MLTTLRQHFHLIIFSLFYFITYYVIPVNGRVAGKVGYSNSRLSGSMGEKKLVKCMWWKDKWKKILFSDENNIQFVRSRRFQILFARFMKTTVEICIISYVGGANVMVWYGFCYCGRSYSGINDELIAVCIGMATTIFILISLALCYIAHEKWTQKRGYYVTV